MPKWTYEKHEKWPEGLNNARNGHGTKKLKGDFGEAEILVPRDRNASFEHKLVAKGQRRWDGFDDKIIAMYARGMSTRDMRNRRSRRCTVLAHSSTLSIF